MMQKYKLFKAIGLIALCIVIYAPVIAQDESTFPIRFGAKVGIGSSNLAVDYLQRLGQARTTISIGGFAQYGFFNWLSVNLDLMYAQAGGANVNPRLFYFKDNPMLGIPELNKSLERTDLLMHRIEIPITANISLPNFEGNIKPILILGPSFGFTVKANAINSYKWDFEAAPNDLVTVTQDDLKDKIQSLDVGGVFGFGVDFDAKPVSYTLGVTYRMSFTETNNYRYSLFPNYTFNTAQVFFAVKFGGGQKIPVPVKVVVPEAEVKFSVYSPANIPTERRVRETFPIRNYVFFDLGSTEISDRY
ncbi:MAG: porin family protein, partial [Bacteroidia bacterium]|nr:porin family protein [Bacteroidia bacterium]